MSFIIQASKQGTLKLISPTNLRDGTYISQATSKNKISHSLITEQGHILSSNQDKLSVNTLCDQPIFVYREGTGDFLVSSSLELILINAKEKISPNLDYFIEYIACGATPRVSTPFLDVFFLPPGSELKYSSTHIDLGREPETENAEVLDTLECSLRKRLSNSQHIALEYSGGLESNILLHSLLNITGSENLQLIHLTDLDSSQIDDVERVKKLAAKYNCKLTILNAEDLKPFQITNQSKIKPNFPHPGLVNIGYINYSSDFLSAKGNMLFNGAGGDSLFCASPQRGLPIELLKKGAVFGAFRNAYHISQYLRSPLISTLLDSVSEFRGMKSKLARPGKYYASINHSDKVLHHDCLGRDYKMRIPFSSRCKEPSSQERHLNAAINRYEMQSSPMAGFADQYICPFLAPEILSNGLMIPSDQLLRGKMDRYMIRKCATDRFNVDEFWHKRKGGVTGLTQRCFSRYKSEIKSFITDGYLVRSQVIDINNVKHLIDEVAAGVAKCPGSLINLLTANIYLHHWKDHIHEF